MYANVDPLISELSAYNLADYDNELDIYHSPPNNTAVKKGMTGVDNPGFYGSEIDFPQKNSEGSLSYTGSATRSSDTPTPAPRRALSTDEDEAPVAQNQRLSVKPAGDEELVM